MTKLPDIPADYVLEAMTNLDLVILAQHFGVVETLSREQVIHNLRVARSCQRLAAPPDETPFDPERYVVTESLATAPVVVVPHIDLSALPHVTQEDHLGNPITT